MRVAADCVPAITPPEEVIFTAEVAVENVGEISQNSPCARAYKQVRFSRAADFRIDATGAVNRAQKCASKIKEIWTKTPSLALACVDPVKKPTAERRCILVATNEWQRVFSSFCQRLLYGMERAAGER